MRRGTRYSEKRKVPPTLRASRGKVANVERRRREILRPQKVVFEGGESLSPFLLLVLLGLTGEIK